MSIIGHFGVHLIKADRLTSLYIVDGIEIAKLQRITT
jgi:hypothetical protein